MPPGFALVMLWPSGWPQVVEQLEKGNLPLQDSLALFERGMLLVRRCTSCLNEAELKITSLSESLDGELS